jgi:hypothetical protein
LGSFSSPRRPDSRWDASGGPGPAASPRRLVQACSRHRQTDDHGPPVLGSPPAPVISSGRRVQKPSEYRVATVRCQSKTTAPTSVTFPSSRTESGPDAPRIGAGAGRLEGEHVDRLGGHLDCLDHGSVIPRARVSRRVVASLISGSRAPPGPKPHLRRSRLGGRVLASIRLVVVPEPVDSLAGDGGAAAAMSPLAANRPRTVKR